MTEKIKTSYLQISNQLIQNYLVQKSFSKRDIESSWICSFLVTKIYALDLNSNHPPAIGSGKGYSHDQLAHGPSHSIVHSHRPGLRISHPPQV